MFQAIIFLFFSFLFHYAAAPFFFIVRHLPSQFHQAHTLYIYIHCFQNWIGSGGWTVKTGNRNENRFFKPKESDFLLIL